MTTAARRVAALALAFATVAAGSGDAAGPVCGLVTDAADDQAFVLPGQAPNDVPGDDLDIRGADVATDSRHVVVAIRLTSLRRFDPTSPGGRHYSLQFTAGGQRYGMSGYVTADAVSAAASRLSPYRDIPATATLDTAASEIRIHAPVKEFGVRGLDRGATVGEIAVRTWYYAGSGRGKVHQGPVRFSWAPIGTGLIVDEAATPRTYRGGTPTCVRMP